MNYSDRFEYDPETFLEVSFGERGKTKTENGIVFVGAVRNLPLAGAGSVGAKTKYGRTERNLSATKECRTNNERKNLIDRDPNCTALAGQSDIGSLTFFFNQEVANPWKPMDPWVEKRLIE